MTARLCPGCTAVLPEDARFCPSCGTAISPAGDERRVVTVLFADVVGFTPLSEDLDPEHVKNLLDRCFERLAADIAAFGGRVDKIVGDEIMAVFGAPVAHEDDPERAVRAALQMQQSLAAQSSQTGSDVRMRIGVNTGEVLVGSLRGGVDVTALGDVVNIAKRLQTAAEPGQVLAGPDTFAATSAVVSYDPVGSMAVKGREAPVEAWAAVEPLGPPGVRPGREGAPVVGRKSEVALLWHALGTAADHQRPHFVLLLGEAGMGKTVLADRAVEIAHTQHDALVIQGRCPPYGEANPWWPVAEALRQACEIDADDPAEVAGRKCHEAIRSLLEGAEGSEAARVADALLYLMGYQGALHDVDPARARDEVVRAIQVCLAANARRRPLVIVLSEIHWADQAVLDLIDTMFDRLRNLPVVLVATARPELEERWAPRPGRHNLYVMNLDPLDRDETAEFVRKLLGSDTPSDLVELVYERSGGNPLFISELVAMVGEGSAGMRHEAIDLPATLRGLVAARVDGLDRADRTVLQDAAVVGRSGSVAVVVALSSSRGEGDAGKRLSNLSHRDFLMVSDGEYEFRSDLVRDVAYETLTKSDRARRHAAVGEWLAQDARSKERQDEFVERIAHHFAQAARLRQDVGSVEGVPDDIVEQALDWLEQSAQRAESRDAAAGTVRLLEHALELLGDDRSERRARFLLTRARGRASARDSAGARADTDAVLEIAEEIREDSLKARALMVRGETEQGDGRLDDSARYLEEAVDLWRRAGDKQGEGEALRLWGFTSIHRGDLDAAEGAIQKALAISRELGDRRGEAWAIQNLAWAAFSRGENDLAETRLREAADLFEEIGDFGGQGWALGLLGYIWYFQGKLDDAALVAEQGLEWTRESGERWGYGMMLNLLAMVRLWQGRTAEAAEHARQAYRLFQDIEDTFGLVFSSNALALSCVLRGDREAGLELANKHRPDLEVAFLGGLGGLLTAASLHCLVGEPEVGLGILSGRPDVSDDPDVRICRSLAELLAGGPQEAYESAAGAMATVPEETGTRANYASTTSIVAAAAARPEEAVRWGEEVGRIGGTYLDRVRAHLGRAFGYLQMGDETKAESALASARRLIDATEDELHKALVRLAEAAVASRSGEQPTAHASRINSVRDELEALNVSWAPWEQAFRMAATGAEVGSLQRPG